MNKAIVLQARNSSTMFPRKRMHDFMGKSALEWVPERSLKAA